MSWVTRLTSPRGLNLSIFLFCGAAITGALLMQYWLDLEPCPLCVFQRVAVIAVGLVCLVAALHHPKQLGHRLYAFFALLLSATGAAIAIRHLWLQNLPADQVPSCGPGLDYMLDVFPFHQVIGMVLHGSGECADVQATFIGLTIPGWTLILFVALLVVSIFQLVRRKPQACPNCDTNNG